ncbi:DNA-binding protein D-ETS-3 [Caerostris extrusa]|uniref:DNA-binding protein D-ETS-3 n=1 Tax=Caerostris extrusa TaxID=172846 RepID=A0AAV4NI84_CAEEX|nr:DNA-binding protein D-ETS-3 [Caerostris extrusa]
MGTLPEMGLDDENLLHPHLIAPLLSLRPQFSLQNNLHSFYHDELQSVNRILYETEENISSSPAQDLNVVDNSKSYETKDYLSSSSSPDLIRESNQYSTLHNSFPAQYASIYNDLLFSNSSQSLSSPAKSSPIHQNTFSSQSSPVYNSAQSSPTYSSPLSENSFYPLLSVDQNSPTVLNAVSNESPSDQNGNQNQYLDSDIFRSSPLSQSNESPHSDPCTSSAINHRSNPSSLLRPGETVKDAITRKFGGISNSVEDDSKDGKVHLWQFLVKLLVNPKRYSSLISWEDNDGKFQFKEPEEVAKLWGERKKRNKQAIKNMTYDKLSRSLRYYYDKKIMKKRKIKEICLSIFNGGI